MVKEEDSRYRTRKFPIRQKKEVAYISASKRMISLCLNSDVECVSHHLLLLFMHLYTSHFRVLFFSLFGVP